MFRPFGACGFETAQIGSGKFVGKEVWSGLSKLKPKK